MRLHRFYVNKPLGEEIVVESAGGNEEKEILNQWLRVFRFTEGDEVLLFSSLTPDFDFRYLITSISKDGVQLSLVSKEENIPARNLTLCMALVKKDTFETIARQATELGVSRIIPVQARRSEKKNLNFDRLSAIAKEAAEQSGRRSIPEIAPICSLEEAYNLTKDCKNVLGSLEGGAPSGIFSDPASSYAVWIGPEGGWAQEEEDFARGNRFARVRFADTVLRADTAAAALLTLAIQS